MIDERKDKLGEQSEEQVNIQELLFRYLIHWPWFVASVLACLIGAWVYLHFQTPVYQVSASIMIKDDKKGGNTEYNHTYKKHRTALQTVHTGIDD